MSGALPSPLRPKCEESTDLPARLVGKVGAMFGGRLQNGYLAAARAAS